MDYSTGTNTLSLRDGVIKVTYIRIYPDSFVATTIGAHQISTLLNLWNYNIMFVCQKPIIF